MAKLNKCPFCGNKNVFVGTDEEIEEMDKGDATGFYAVVCNFNNKGCGATSGYRSTKAVAIQAWNMRETN